MQAITYHRYGGPDVLELEEVEQPVPGDGEVLVRVQAASVNPRDWHFLRGLPYVLRPVGLRRPRDGGLGSDLAGRVEAVGQGVTRFRPGDEVYAHVHKGAFAENTCIPEHVLGPKPANLGFEQAAAVPLAALTALQGLRDHGRVRPGQRVLIVGASGGVGTFAHTFDRPGTYPYRCTVHDGMTGRVVVTAAGSAQTVMTTLPLACPVSR